MELIDLLYKSNDNRLFRNASKMSKPKVMHINNYKKKLGSTDEPEYIPEVFSEDIVLGTTGLEKLVTGNYSMFIFYKPTSEIFLQGVDSTISQWDILACPDDYDYEFIMDKGGVYDGAWACRCDNSSVICLFLFRGGEKERLDLEDYLDMNNLGTGNPLDIDEIEETLIDKYKITDFRKYGYQEFLQAYAKLQAVLRFQTLSNTGDIPVMGG